MQLIERLAQPGFHRDVEELGQELQPDQIADLYIWLERHYPRSEDPEIGGIAHMVSPRESIGLWRDTLLRLLQQRPSDATARAILHIEQELPELKFLTDVRQDAQTEVRAAKWRPPTIAQLALLTVTRESRYVTNSSDLLDLVHESISRFNDKLTSNRMQWLAWNEDHKSSLASPKDETQLSQFLALHLQYELTGRRQVTINREVDVSRYRFIDIKAELLIPDADGHTDPLTVCIEVKGCWHPKLWSAMESQLKGEYLAPVTRERGIYVVFWFHCDFWKSESRRKKARELRQDRSFADVQRVLNSQASSLSADWAQIRSFLIDASLDANWLATLRHSGGRRRVRDGEEESSDG